MKNNNYDSNLELPTEIIILKEERACQSTETQIVRELPEYRDAYVEKTCPSKFVVNDALRETVRPDA